MAALAEPEKVLKRIRDSVPQIELMGAKREENVKGVFSLEGDPESKTILLVDDVLTTGATVNECARVLLKGGARKIDVFTVARAGRVRRSLSVKRSFRIVEKRF